jgi:ankyrin repeat protein
MEGNTPLHLAMESAHGETAALLIEAGADRSRVSHCLHEKKYFVIANVCMCHT